MIAHAFGDHTTCRKEVCFDAGEFEPSAIDLELAPTDFKIRTGATVANLVSHASGLIENDTSSLAESYMHLVAKFTGGKQSFYGAGGSFLWRTHAAGLAFQNGPSWHGKAGKDAIGHSPCQSLKRMAEKCTNTRLAAKRSLSKDYSDGSLAQEKKEEESHTHASTQPRLRGKLPVACLEPGRNHHRRTIHSRNPVGDTGTANCN